MFTDVSHTSPPPPTDLIFVWVFPMEDSHKYSMAVSKIKSFSFWKKKKKTKMQRQLSDKHQKIHLQMIILKITFISSTVYCQEKKMLTISLWIKNWVAPVNLHLMTIRNTSIKTFKFISGLIRKFLVLVLETYSQPNEGSKNFWLHFFFKDTKKKI